MTPRARASRSTAPPGRTSAATSAIAYRTRWPSPRRSMRSAWSRSRDPGGSIVTRLRPVRSRRPGSAAGARRAASCASSSTEGGKAPGISNSSRIRSSPAARDAADGSTRSGAVGIGGQEPLAEKCWKSTVAAPAAAPAPSDPVEGPDQGPALHGHARAVGRAPQIGDAGRVGGAAARDVRVLDRVDVDRAPVGVLAPAARSGHRATVEGGGVVGLDAREVVAAVGLDRAHAANGEAGPVELPESLHDVARRPRCAPPAPRGGGGRRSRRTAGSRGAGARGRPGSRAARRWGSWPGARRG